MTVVDVSTEIAAPPASVEAVLLDASLAPAWTSGLERLELVEGTPGTAGCVGRAHYLEGGRRYVLDDVLVEAVPATYYRSHITGNGLSIDVETFLEPTPDGGTTMRLRWSGTGTTTATRMILPLIRSRIRRRAKADLDALRRLVEGSST